MELRDKILSFSCGKSSPALEFFDSKHKRRRRRTKLRLPRLFINTSEVNFEYQSQNLSPVSSGQNLELGKLLKALDPSSHFLQDIDQSTNYLGSLEQSFDTTRKIKHYTLPTVRSRMSSIGETHKLRDRDISISFSGSVLHLEQSEHPEQQEKVQRIKHIEHEKPFKLTSRNKKIQQPIITSDVFHSLDQKSTKYPLYEWIYQNQTLLLTSLIFKHFQTVLEILFRSLEILQMIQDLKLFSRLVLYISQLCLDVGMDNQAAFMFGQSIAIAELTQNYDMKSQSLIWLGECARRFQLYNQSLQILKKALVYAWRADNGNLEVACYEQMGLSCFYLGEMKDSELFHLKWSLAEKEPQSGYYKKTAREFVRFFEMYLPFKVNTISKQLMFQLSLPIMNMLEEEPTRCDQFKMIKFDKCDGAVLINELIQSREFVQFNLDYIPGHKKHHSKSTSQKRIVNRESLPRAIVEIQDKYKRFEKHYEHDHNYMDNPLYHPPVENKIFHRLKKDMTLGADYFDRVQKQIGVSRQPYGEKQPQKYMRHLIHRIQKPESHEFFYRRHCKLLTELFKI